MWRVEGDGEGEDTGSRGQGREVYWNAGKVIGHLGQDEGGFVSFVCVCV